MTEFIRFALLGIGPGAMFALMGLGIVVIFRGSGVLNFAHGAAAMLAAFVYHELRFDHSVPTAIAMVVGVAASSLVGVVTHLGIMRPLREAAPLTKVIATLGVMISLQSFGLLRWGSDSKVVPPSLPSEPWRITDEIVIGRDRVYLLAIVCVLAGALSIFYRSTRFGIATSAAAENPLAAEALGVSSNKVGTWNWAIGGALAGLAGILITPIINLDLISLTLLVIVALAAALVGGFTSIPLTLAAGVAIGVAQSVMTRYVTRPGAVDAVPLVIIVLFLVLRGTSLPVRGFVGQRMPRLGTGIVKARFVIPVVAAVLAVFWLLLGEEWDQAALTSMLISLFCLSLVVVTGYTGQVSLAQYALGGMGAWAAGLLVTDHGWPFWLALLAGVIVATLVGLVVALPALRTRGVTLAIVTLALGVVLQVMIFNQTRDRRLPPPTLFGWEVDALRHPERYLTVVIVAFTLVAVGLGNLRRSRVGRRLVAVRANERAAAALGVNPFEAKLYAFAIGSAIAGLAGVLLAFRQSFIVYASFDAFGNINIVAWGVIGGIGYIIGPIWSGGFAPAGIGAQVFSFFESIDSYVPLVGGLSLILILIQHPDGLAEPHVHVAHAIAARRAARRGRRERRQAEEAASLLTTDDVTLHTRVQPATLTIRSLSVSFGGVKALHDVSLDVGPGEIVGLIGPNGAGKTTLIDAVTGYVKPRGSVSLDGVPIDRLSAHGRARAGIARSWQSLELFEDMTVLDNLRAAAEDRSRLAYLVDLFRPRSEKLPLVASAAVREFGLTEDLHRLPDELPYGKRRLVAIARAVAAGPSVLLLDEPAAGLDETEVRELGKLVRRLAAEWGLAVLLIEHDVQMVMDLSDRIVALDFGTKIADGTPEEVANDPEVIAAYLGVTGDTGPTTEATEEIHLVPRDDSHVQAGSQ